MIIQRDRNQSRSPTYIIFLIEVFIAFQRNFDQEQTCENKFMSDRDRFFLYKGVQ